VNSIARPLFVVALVIFCINANAAELKPWDGGATPALALEDLSGKAHRLADYKGKVVLVNFWATWCEPCRAEMPSMDQLRRSLAGRPFEVLAVNLAEPRARIEKFTAAGKLGFPILLDREAAASRDWRARVLPASYLVGRDGRIRYSAFGDVDWMGEGARGKVLELLR